MATRRYEQRVRATTAAETRRRILDAVTGRLVEAPAERISLDVVAARAGVARSTIYATFGSRAGLFDAVGMDILVRGGFEEMVRSVLQDDARQALRQGIERNVSMYAANRDVLRALYSMAQLEPAAVGDAVNRLERGRAEGMAGLAERLERQGVLHPGLGAREATDRLWLLTGFDSFDLLHTGRGMSADKVARLLAETAERSLCRPSES